MKRWALLLLLGGCLDDNLCPLVPYVDAFELVLSSDSWNMAQYRIEVSYADKYGAATFRCDVPVPALPPLDAGVTLAPDAGVDARGHFACTPVMPTGRLAGGIAGQELVLDFEGTPDSARVLVRDGERVVLDQNVALGYELVRPYGEDCPGPFRASARIELP